MVGSRNYRKSGKALWFNAAILFAAAVLIGAAFLFPSNPKTGQASWVPKTNVTIVQPIEKYQTGAGVVEGSYGMPATFNKTYRIISPTASSQYNIMKTGDGAALPNTPFATMADVVTAINGNYSAGDKVQIMFGDISEPVVMARNEYFTLSDTKGGTFVFEGGLTGDRTNMMNEGILHFAPNGTGTSTMQTVYLNNFQLINNGSWNRQESMVTGSTNTTSISTSANKDPDTGLGLYRPEGLTTAAANVSFPRPVNIYILGNSSVKVTNGVWKSKYERNLTDPENLGYTTNAYDSTGTSLIGISLSLAFDELSAGGGTYPEALENSKTDMLKTAYGGPGNAKYDYYATRPLDSWVKSARDPSADDFADIHTGFHYALTGSYSTVKRYYISTKQPGTGRAIYYTGSGSVVIDTTGEISNSGASMEFPAVSIAAGSNFVNTLNNNNRTRLYVANGNIKNLHYDANYLRTYSRSAATGAYNAPTNASAVISTGYTFNLAGTLAAGQKVVGDLLAGGNYSSSGTVLYVSGQPTVATYNAAHLTVGGTGTGAAGPQMVAGVATGTTGVNKGNTVMIRYLGTQVPLTTTQTTVGYGAIYIDAGGQYTADGTAYNSSNPVLNRADIVFLNGDLISHRHQGLVVAGIGAYDVHLAGGNWRNEHTFNPGGTSIAPSQFHTSTFVSNSSTSSSTNQQGSTIWTYGGSEAAVGGAAHEAKPYRPADVIPTASGGISATGINMTAGVYVSSVETQGFFQATSTVANEPAFRFKGGNFVNMNGTVYAHMLFFTGAGISPIYIEGGNFETPAGCFLITANTAKDVVMTGGYFKNTAEMTGISPVRIGYSSVGVYSASVASRTHDPSGYARYNSAGELVEQAASSRGYGGTGIVYFNGGRITSNNGATGSGIINISKSNYVTSMVMGLNREDVVDINKRGSAEERGYSDNNKAAGVTEIVNKSGSPMVYVAPGVDMTDTVAMDSSISKTFRAFVFSNSHLAIDDVKFTYTTSSSDVSSISAPLVLPYETYPINFPTIRFTGTLAGMGNTAISTGVNVVELAPTFKDTGYNSSHKHILNISGINYESFLNGTVIRNYVGDETPGTAQAATNWYADHFTITPIGNINYTAESLRLRPVELQAGYGHTLGAVGKDWVNFASLSVNWFTQKGVETDGTTSVALTNIAYSGSEPKFTVDYYRETYQTPPNPSLVFDVWSNIPAGFGKATPDWTLHDRYGTPVSQCTDKVFRANSGVPSYYTYGQALGVYSGLKFGAGELSAGLPKLSMPGYQHLGWTYTGPTSPYYNYHQTGIYTNPEVKDYYINADDLLMSNFDHFVVAVWKLDDPEIEPSATIGGVAKDKTQLNDLIRVYDAKEIKLTGHGSHESEAAFASLGMTMTFTYGWSYSPTGAAGTYTAITGGSVSAYNKNYSTLSDIINVAQSGHYKLTLTVEDDTIPVPMSASVDQIFVVTISPKEMTSANIRMPQADEADTGQLRSPMKPGAHATGMFLFVDNGFHDPTDSGGWTALKANPATYPGVLGWFEDIGGGNYMLMGQLIDGTKMDYEAGGFDFTVSPGLDNGFLASRAWPYYFNFYGNYSGVNVHVDFIIPGITTITFGNLMGGKTVDEATGLIDIPMQEPITATIVVEGVPKEVSVYPTLPVPTPVNGYVFKEWRFNGLLCQSGEPVRNEISHTLMAVWDFAEIAITTKVNNVAVSSLEFDFDRAAHTIVASATVGGYLPAGVTFLYSWILHGSSDPGSAIGNASLSRTWVVEAGTYDLTVTARDKNGTEDKVKTIPVEVVINKKLMNTADIYIPTVREDGSAQSAQIFIYHDNYLLNVDTDYDIVSGSSGTYITAGAYPFTFNFKGNYANYGGAATIGQNFNIVSDTVISFGNLKPGLVPTTATAAAVVPALGKYPFLADPTLPSDFKGYTFLRWEYGGVEVTGGQDLLTYANHVLMAVWDLKNPTVSLSVPSLSFPYDRLAHDITASASLDGLAGISFSYTWTKSGGGGTKLGETASFTNVSETGSWILYVTATDGSATKTFTSSSISVAISQRNLNDSVISIETPAAFWTGNNVMPNIIASHTNLGGIAQLTTSDYTWSCAAVPDKDAFIEGNFTLVFTGTGNYTGSVSVPYTVIKATSVSVAFSTSIGTAPDPFTPDGGIYPADLYTKSDYYVTLIPAGYTFKYWAYASETGARIYAGDPLKSANSHILYAVIELNALTITNAAALKTGIANVVYTRAGYTLDVETSILDNPVNISYKYEWTKGGVPVQSGSDSVFKVTNVLDGGSYTLKVTATGLAGKTATAQVTDIEISILTKNLKVDADLQTADVVIIIPEKSLYGTQTSVSFGESSYSILYEGVQLKSSTEYVIEYYDGTSYTTTIPASFDSVGSPYAFRFSAGTSGNFSGSRMVELVVTTNTLISFYTRIGSIDGSQTNTPVSDAYPTLYDVTGTIPDGYKFVGWVYNGPDPVGGRVAESGQPLRYLGSHTLEAVWELDGFTVDTSASGYSGTFNWNSYYITASAKVAGNAPNSSYFDFVYTWKKVAGAGVGTERTGSRFSATNVSDNGTWTLTVTVIDKLYGLALLSPLTVEDIVIAIVAVNISTSAVSVDDVSVPYVNRSTPYSPSFVAVYMGGQLVKWTLSTDGFAHYTLTATDEFGIALSPAKLSDPNYLIGSGVYWFEMAAADVDGNFMGSRLVKFTIVRGTTSVTYNLALHDTTVYTADGQDVADALDNFTAKLLAAPDFAQGFGFGPGVDYSMYIFQHWTYMGSKVVPNDSMPAIDIYLVAVWTVKTPQVTVDGTDGYIALDDLYTLTFVYDRAARNIAVDIIDDLGDFYLSYTWYKDNVFSGRSGDTLPVLLAVTNVSDSALYRLQIVIRSMEGFECNIRLEFRVTITPKTLTNATAYVSIASKTYNGRSQNPDELIMDGAFKLNAGAAADYTVTGLPHTDAGTYAYSFELRGNYAGTLTGNFTINPVTLTFANDKVYGAADQYANATDDGKYPLSMPVPADIPGGYSFESWRYFNGAVYVDVLPGQKIPEDLLLTANPTLIPVWQLAGAILSNIGADISRIYNQTFTNLTLAAGHAAEGAAMIFYAYQWSRYDSALQMFVQINNMTNSLTVINVADSGRYRLTVSVSDGKQTGMESWHDFEVSIRPKEITEDMIVINKVYYDGTDKTPFITITDGDYILELGVDYTCDAGTYIDVGKYDINFAFHGNYTGNPVKAFNILNGHKVFPWWAIVLVAGGGLLLAAGIIAGVYSRMIYKRRKYGMKRHIHSFMDDFDVHE